MRLGGAGAVVLSQRVVDQVDDLLASALAGSARHGAIVRFGRPAVVGPWALRQVPPDVHLPTYAGVGRTADALTSTEAYRRLVRVLVNRLKAVDPRTADRVLAVSFAIMMYFSARRACYGVSVTTGAEVFGDAF